MKKIIRPSDWLLLGLAGFLDFIKEIRDPFNLLENYYRNFYGFVPLRFKKDNLYHLVWRNLKTGNIRKIIIKGKVYLELTSVGEEKIKGKYPILSLVKKSWDRIFRVVIYDIEEISRSVRELLRKKLKELGFGMFQKSVWISPYDFLGDFQEFLRTHHLTDKVVLIETKNLYVGNLKKLAKKVWKINKINGLYKSLYKALLAFKSLTKDDDRHQKLKSLRKRIIAVYLKDPFLPKEFLPENWLGEEVRKLVKELRIFQ